MEAFLRLLQSNIDAGLIQGFKINKYFPSINHLFSADGCFLFFRANTSQIHHFQQIIHVLSEDSGQVINAKIHYIFW